MTYPGRLHILGDVFCDIVCSGLPHLPRPDQDVLGQIQLLPGGSGLNIACHAA
eukprot:CAMPEP_0173175824 /NCGR_PEP_ID=MMETSP1141-20130122/4120_1 /TAXON_ID=483371 /ORGANISM="non described non described, Strain CCMP2298" /LENGTH=52 /DNA_ID=CAMNT_0014098097 /DNA_START=163 /DNA_END=318 /DNA_ORIENTATION=-